MKSLDFKLYFPAVKGMESIPANELEIIEKYSDYYITVYESELKEISYRELESAFFDLIVGFGIAFVLR